MALKTITKKVVSFSEIPEELTEKHWVNEHACGAFVECHIDEDESEEQRDGLTIWLIANYPELVEETSFFIELDY